MTKHTITALYDSREYANNAVLMLRQAGIADADVGTSPESATAGYAEDARPQDKGFWASLKDIFGGTDDHETYTEGVRRGGILVTAHVDDAQVDEIVEILEQHGSVDFDEREASWRSEGWSGGSAVTGRGVADTGAGPLRSIASAESTRTELAANPVAAPQLAAVASAPVTASNAARPVSAAKGTSRTAGDEGIIQIAEESITVGKRAVNRGKVRIHSHVVETPFVQQVSLRDETVTVDRRPMDRPIGLADLGPDAFRDRTIEMDEVDEEAVVAKSVRVVEEVVLHKSVADRIETVTDTVRRTQVDVEDNRTSGRTATPFGGASTLQPAKEMEVVGSDGQHVGVIDHVDGGSIKLKRLDPASGGSHHQMPVEWVQMVDQKVTLKVTAADAKSRWTAA